jgi:hypothetical protein
MSTLHKFIYKYSGNVFLGERYPQQEMSIQSKCEDLDAHELLSLFKSYMLSCGYAEKSFYDACESAADENNPYRKGGNRYEMGETERGNISSLYEDTIKNSVASYKGETIHSGGIQTNLQ